MSTLSFCLIMSCSRQPSYEYTPLSQLVSIISDKIIPETETPGAIGAGVPDYIMRVLEGHFTAAQRVVFEKRIRLFDELAILRFQAPFHGIQETQQISILETLDVGVGSKSIDFDDASWGELIEVWGQLKRLTLFGFYTSETATEELAYEQIPGRYVGCVPYEDVGRAWIDPRP